MAMLWPKKAEAVVIINDEYVPEWRAGVLILPPQEPYTPKTNIHINSQQVTTGIGNGWCVDLVKQYRPDLGYISGNANKYFGQAKRTGNTPVVGAVISTYESWAGHVAIVEKVNENTIEIVEQNYKGRYIVSTRTINKDNAIIQGYIYE